MAIRVIEVFMNAECSSKIEKLIENDAVLDWWCTSLSDNQKNLRILLTAEKSEEILDILEKEFSGVDGFRIIILSVEASIPRLEEPEKDKQQKGDNEKTEHFRVSREELYQDLSEMVRTSWVEITTVILSAIVATIGLTRNSPAIIIGAMVIAPMLGPNVAQAFSTNMGDYKLGFKAVKANILRTAIAFIFAFVTGFVLKVNPEIPEVVSRTVIGYGDIILAFAAGVAAALSLTTGVSTSLIGVMVAVSLLPPLATSGLLLGSGYSSLAFGAFTLFMINVTCVNLATIITFTFQGISPKKWWEADKAKKSIKAAIVSWAILLSILLLLIIFSGKII